MVCRRQGKLLVCVYEEGKRGAVRADKKADPEQAEEIRVNGGAGRARRIDTTTAGKKWLMAETLNEVKFMRYRGKQRTQVNGGAGRGWRVDKTIAGKKKD